MELLKYCYDPTWYNLFDMISFSSPDDFFISLGEDFDVLKSMNLTADIPAKGLKLSMIMAMVTYGRVTEVIHPVGSDFNGDAAADAGKRQLVCRYSNNDDFIIDRQTYLQLSIRTGAVNWVDSELWYPMNNGLNDEFENNFYFEHSDRKPVGMFTVSDWILPVNDAYGLNSDSLQSPALDWKTPFTHPFNMDTPARRGICRIQHEGEWHYGNVVRVGFIEKIENWANSDTFDDYFVHCGAFTKDGTYVEARIQQKFTPKNDQWDIFDKPSQYLVQVPTDDGSMWGDWSEWSKCSKTCGSDAVRSRTRSCLDGNGNAVAPHTAVNCLPEKGSHDANNWNFSGLQGCVLGPDFNGDC